MTHYHDEFDGAKEMEKLAEETMTEEEKAGYYDMGPGDAKLALVKAILKSHGIEMNIGGCGCCGSPWVSLKYNGEVILDKQEHCSIYMFKEEKEEKE